MIGLNLGSPTSRKLAPTCSQGINHYPFSVSLCASVVNIEFMTSSESSGQPSLTVIGKGLFDLLAGIHHKGTAACHRFLEWLT